MTFKGFLRVLLRLLLVILFIAVFIFLTAAQEVKYKWDFDVASNITSYEQNRSSASVSGNYPIRTVPARTSTSNNQGFHSEVRVRTYHEPVFYPVLQGTGGTTNINTFEYNRNDFGSVLRSLGNANAYRAASIGWQPVIPVHIVSWQ